MLDCGPQKVNDWLEAKLPYQWSQVVKLNMPRNAG